MYSVGYKRHRIIEEFIEECNPKTNYKASKCNDYFIALRRIRKADKMGGKMFPDWIYLDGSKDWNDRYLDWWHWVMNL